MVENQTAVGRLCRLELENATGHSWRTSVNTTKEIRHSRISAVATHNNFISHPPTQRRGPSCTDRKTGRRTPEFFSPLPGHPVINPMQPFSCRYLPLLVLIIAGRIRPDRRMCRAGARGRKGGRRAHRSRQVSSFYQLLDNSICTQPSITIQITHGSHTRRVPVSPLWMKSWRYL